MGTNSNLIYPHNYLEYTHPRSRQTMAQHQQVLTLTDGEKLAILISRDGRKVEEIAIAWGKSRQQIARYTNENNLNPKVIKRACEILGVPESIFDARLNADQLLNELDTMRTAIDNLNHRVQVLEAEKNGLSDAIKILNTPPKKEGSN